MEHLGIRAFMVLGFRIGGPFAWNLLRRAPGRIPAAVMAQPSGFRPELPTFFYDNNIAGRGAKLRARRPEITEAMVEAILTRMYRTDADFVFTVTRDVVRAAGRRYWCCRTTCPRTPMPSRWRARCSRPQAR
jgi:pimeloyl-ACP methyl ester carboxylesterase